jgi:[ribosomal protein S18]-alanine N-acetyltransferase
VAISKSKIGGEVPPEEGQRGRDPAGSLGSPIDHLHFKKMSQSDLEQIMRIEKASFAYPWSARFFLQELGVPCSRSLIAVINGRTVGYIIYWFLASEIDIHNLAVDPGYRRQGIGRSLLHAVIEEARDSGLTRVTLEVRKSNDTAQRLYQSAGFAVQGVRSGYYSDDGEDALAMVLEFKEKSSAA